MKNVLKLVTLLLLSLGVAAAQQGFYRAPAPGTVAAGNLQSPITSGISWTLCPASLLTGGSTLASCITSPVAATSDQAGSSAITQPGSVSGNGWIQFYAPAGSYALAVSYSFPSDIGTQIYGINVNSDLLGNAALNDGYALVPPAACVANVSSGTAATGNNTFIVDGSVPALEGKTTAAAATLQFVCNIDLPTRLTSGKGIVINDLTFLYSQQGTNTTLSMSTPTLNSFTAPVAGTSETASSATLVAAGGTLAPVPVVASANLTAVSAGQYYSEKIGLGTPVSFANLQNLVLNQAFANSGSVAMLITTPGVIVHYSIAQ